MSNELQYSTFTENNTQNWLLIRIVVIFECAFAPENIW